MRPELVLLDVLSSVATVRDRLPAILPSPEGVAPSEICAGCAGAGARRTTTVLTVYFIKTTKRPGPELWQPCHVIQSVYITKTNGEFGRFRFLGTVIHLACKPTL